MTAYRIKEGEFESWHKEWYTTAKQIYSLADSALAAGQRISARKAFLRATNYYRTTEFFCTESLKTHEYYPHGRTVGIHLDRLVN
ncbi:hypothetical protein [Bacillus sp. SD088]|uniref:hypothetical protein n=1 Tax=Bacillus sp. SD088 TaxID=2782012 RepID=UPI001A958965|nr:hypothetical protein [Bacillus sp. SD088]